MTTAYLRECLPKILASVWIQCFNFTLISVKHGFDIVTEENIVEAESFRIAYIRYAIAEVTGTVQSVHLQEEYNK